MFTPPCVSFQAKKNGRRKADQPPAAAIYAAQTEAAQPPDDRTYSAEVTVFRRNLLHHRSAHLEKFANFPYTRSIMIPRIYLFVKHIFRNNHKNFYIFSSISQNLNFIKIRLILPPQDLPPPRRPAVLSPHFPRSPTPHRNGYRPSVSPINLRASCLPCRGNVTQFKKPCHSEAAKQPWESVPG